MAHFACISLPYQGHLNPMIAVAKELRARGHTTTFLHVVDVGALVRTNDLDFVPVGLTTHPPGWLAEATHHCGAVTGVCGLAPVMRDFASITDMLCKELPDVLRALSVDMILVDQLEAAGGLVAYRLGLPFVSIAAALPLNWEEGIPSPFIGWSYGATRWHRYRNIASAYGAKRARGPIGDVIQSFAAQWGVDHGGTVEDYMSGLAQLSQLVPSLDFPRSSLTRCFHYCGPLRTATPPPSPRRGNAKRAFASLGTLQGHRVKLFEQIATAAAACDLDLTIAHGGRLTQDDVVRLSGHATVVDFVDHSDVLAGADLAILHGGLNSTLDALAHGVPTVLLPLAFEQSATAARVRRAGAGLVCASHTFRSSQLVDAIEKVCVDPSYATTANALRREIEQAGGVRQAADIVEYVQETGRPSLVSEQAARSIAPDYAPVRRRPIAPRLPTAHNPGSRRPEPLPPCRATP
jgi:zeaxanthin glucosyltransferase